ncbi:hypothetical protein Ctob_002572 [Chrysochromulina tobinii]|uniref:Uncharacterized protein n=1 Tax=Chrysochromulina tobinii TaxID=1460289 RepID=A0A0M0J8X4_9EUKA|nr:hypothetical protein Ctob_002572 [Chrysochromulina tobinii]|eukprot:KOO22930.1 hypothetical protein Ctob_002572 [Chrysochromulina sp. CCMP291]
MGKKGKGKGKKGPEDWGARDVEKYVTVEIRNSVWQSMRFTQLLGTSTKLSHLVQLIMDKHQVSGLHGLYLYLGTEVDDSALLRSEEYGLTLKDVNFKNGSINDQIVQVVTYEYAPHKTHDAGTMPPSRSYGISNLPQGLMLPSLRSAAATSVPALAAEPAKK